MNSARSVFGYPVAALTGLANAAALAAVSTKGKVSGLEVTLADGSNWIYSSTSAAADTTSQLVVTPTTGSGRWLRTDKVFDLSLACAFGTADAAVLLTVPVGCSLRLEKAFWDVSVAWTGGTSSAIGLSSSNAGFSTKGDLLGGASGDVLAGLTTGKKGTVGAKMSGNLIVTLGAADTIRFDRITSAFTAGAANAIVSCRLIAHPGA